MGPCAGGAVYSPALTDFIFMVEETSYMFVTGPNVVKTVTHEEVSSEELGGAKAHAEKSGVNHFTATNDVECLKKVRDLVTYFPQNASEMAPQPNQFSFNPSKKEAIRSVLPENVNVPYDIRKVVECVIDDNSFREVQEDFAKNIVVGFARLEGRSIGIVANQPAALAGVLDIDASRKGARFVRFCDSFNIPLLVFEDVPGFLPGTDQEWRGIITHGAKLLYAFSEATVPRITVITRKAYGGAFDVMNSKNIGADMNYAWPTAEIAVMGAKGAAEIIFKREIAEAANPEEKWKEKEAEYADLFANPYRAAERGIVDDVILPEETREKLIAAFKMLENKAETLPYKKHGNIPL
jgi:propionyl-CoA carboxylase beta chain